PRKTRLASPAGSMCMGLRATIRCRIRTRLDSPSLAQLGAEHPKVAMAAAIALVGGGAGELGDVLVGAYEAGKTLDEGGTASESALSQAGKAADRAGLTKAGRALAKHCGREVSVFPQASGNPAAINEQGQAALDDILNGVTKTEANKY